MPGRRLKAYLDEQRVPYVTLTHEPTFTTQRTAEAAHIPGHLLAKTVIVTLDGRAAMAVVPSSDRVHLDALADAAGAATAALASEAEFERLFPDVELGAIPPFGNLYGLPVFVSEELAASREIAFNAGTHREVMRLAYEDFERLVRPTVVRCSTHELFGART